MISNKGIICKTIQFPSKQMNYAEQLSLWMNIHPFCVFCSDWRSPEVCVYVTRTNWSVIYIRYVQCQMRSGRSHAMAKAISRAATLVIYEPDWLGYPLLHYLMNWLYYLSLSLEREWCVCWARTGNHSVTLDARMIWLMQALSLACWKGSLKRFSLTLIWRLSWLTQISWSLSSNWSHSKIVSFRGQNFRLPRFFLG